MTNDFFTKRRISHFYVRNFCQISFNNNLKPSVYRTFHRVHPFLVVLYIDWPNHRFKPLFYYIKFAIVTEYGKPYRKHLRRGGSLPSLSNRLAGILRKGGDAYDYIWDSSNRSGNNRLADYNRHIYHCVVNLSRQEKRKT